MSKQLEEFERGFASAATTLAHEDPITLSSVKLKLRLFDTSDPTRTRALKAALKVTRGYHDRGQLGRLRAALLIGTTIFGANFVVKAERARILLSDSTHSDKFHQFLEHLAAEAGMEASEGWSLLENRLRTYLAYDELVRATALNQHAALRSLRTRPREIIKKLLALTHLRFLSYLEHPVPAAIAEWLDEFGPPEELASIVSLLIAHANETHPLDSIDFALPLTAKIADAEVRVLMEYGRGLHQRYEVSKDISLFGYALQIDTKGQSPVFYLRPPSAEFEYAMRLGFIRSDIGRTKAHRDASADASRRPVSILGAAEFFANRLRDRICELKDENTPLSRILIKLPIVPELYKAVLEGGFYEDFAEQEELSLDFLAPLRGQGEPELQLTNALDLGTFLKIWRLLRFLCFVDICAVRSFQNVGEATLYNSVLRVAKEEDLSELVATMGIERGKVTEFLRLVSADTQHLGYLDLQYRPFLRIMPSPIGNDTSPREIVYVPALVGFANALRNVQSANQLRLKRNAELLVEATADVLGRSFQQITTNRQAKALRDDTGTLENTDIDVVRSRVRGFTCSSASTQSHQRARMRCATYGKKLKRQGASSAQHWQYWATRLDCTTT
jgi:hypothetical protein